ncbi:MAG TPA: TonB-dependent receptor [Terriglobales bacterium]|nr:TonB-dependent receptor [Terriglobales bacterium]
MSTRGLFVPLFVLLFVALLASQAFAQATISFATLRGTVQDEGGRTVLKAAITLREPDRNLTYSATTNENGYYVVPNLPPGTYELTVANAGFAKYVRTGIPLSVGQTATVNVTLKVAAATEVIKVTTEAPPVETTRTEISNVIETQQITNLPVSGRLFTDFALLTPGVATGRTSLGTTFTEFEVTQISFGGQRSFSNIITVDGADFINAQTGVQRATPPQESVQEFRVVNNSFGSEYGRALGGIVNVVTKSGTNEVHGSIYDYLQNDAVDARSFLQPAPAKHTLRQNQFGGTLGGPLRKNKTFFFLNYEGQRRGESPTLPSDFRNNFDVINLAKSYLGIPVEPLETLKTKDNDYGFARLDHQINNNNRLALRYNVEDARDLNTLVGQTEDGGGIGTPSGGRNLFIRDQSVVGTLNTVLKPELVNTVLGQYSRRHYNFPGATGQPDLSLPNDLEFGHNFGTLDAIYESRAQFSDSIGWIKGNHYWKFGYDSNYIWDYSNFPGFTPTRIIMPGLNCLIEFANFVDFGGGPPIDSISDQPGCPDVPGNFQDGVAVTFFGVALPRTNGPGADQYHEGFVPTGPFGGGAVDHNWPNAFVPGLFPSYAFTMNHGYQGFFAQDQWRVTPKLTLNYGVRWDFETGLSRQIDSYYGAWQPRVGFAYSPDAKTVIRAGAGLFYDRNNMTFFFITGNQKNVPGFLCNPTDANPGCAGSTPITLPMVRNGAGDGGWQLDQVVSLTNIGIGEAAANQARDILLTGLYPPQLMAGLCDPPLGQFNCNGPGAGGMDRHNSKLPYAEQASFEIDREIGRGLTVDIGYLFVGAHRLIRGNNLNVSCPDGTSKPGNPADAQGWLNPDGSHSPCEGTPILEFGKPHFTRGPEFTNAGLLDFNNGVVNANYHGLTLQAIERIGRHFALNANYTFSKSIDNGNFTTFINLPQNQFDYNAERALSNQDVRHRFVMNFSATTPDHGSVLVKDWVLSSIITVQSGRPFTLFAGFDANGDTNPVTDRVGIVGRNTYIGDPLRSWDARVSRSFNLTERMKVNLSFDAFNALNRPNVDEVTSVFALPDFFGNPVPKHYKDGIGSPANPGFGTPRTMLNPRQLQFAMKFSF